MNKHTLTGFLISLLMTLLISACGLAEPVNAPTLNEASPTATPPQATVPPTPLVSAATWTPTILPSATETTSPTVTPTPDPYVEYSVEALASREYGGGALEIVDTLAQNSLFTRYSVKYPSEGLDIYGFMNVPLGDGPFPVIIALHGYIDPEIYQTLDYTTDNADAIARAGYLVIHPNLRGYFPSDSGPNLFRVGMALDVLNLIAIVEEQGGKPGPLELANPGAIGLWGHSMGGGISTRVITVSDAVDAAVLYGAMSGDERRNFEAIYEWSEGERGLEELSAPVEALERISPIYHLERIQAAVSIHHGGGDELVPLDWSLELCDRLAELGKNVECFTYGGQPHTIYGESEDLFNRRVLEFYDRYLKVP